MVMCPKGWKWWRHHQADVYGKNSWVGHIIYVIRVDYSGEAGRSVGAFLGFRLWIGILIGCVGCVLLTSGDYYATSTDPTIVDTNWFPCSFGITYALWWGYEACLTLLLQYRQQHPRRVWMLLPHMVITPPKVERPDYQCTRFRGYWSILTNYQTVSIRLLLLCISTHCATPCQVSSVVEVAATKMQP